MANSGGVRGFGASVVGWLIVAILVYFLFGFVAGTFFWLLRALVIVFVIGGLLTLYFKLRDGD